nr:immunoglobulin heavy chain junction region [Mus musculus]
CARRGSNWDFDYW